MCVNYFATVAISPGDGSWSLSSIYDDGQSTMAGPLTRQQWRVPCTAAVVVYQKWQWCMFLSVICVLADVLSVLSFCLSFCLFCTPCTTDIINNKMKSTDCVISLRVQWVELNWIEQGLTSHQTHYRSYRGRVLQVKRPNQQCIIPLKEESPMD